MQQHRFLMALAPCKRKASLSRGQQLLSKLVYVHLEARTSVRERRRSQLKSDELDDSVVALFIHKVSLPRDCGDSAGRQHRMELFTLKRSTWRPLLLTRAERPIRKLHVGDLAIITWRQLFQNTRQQGTGPLCSNLWRLFRNHLVRW